VEIRALAAADWALLWPIIHDIVAAQETFTVDPKLREADAQQLWIEPPPGVTVVAVERGQIVGTAKTGPNRSGPGAHIATASFMVGGDARGRGVGGALCRYALEWARRTGYAGMQFNALVETNIAAVELYRDQGFEVLGTVPAAFDHPRFGRVGLRLMYRPLAGPD
jgi:GNAT superfamily N-acetyltransferase